MRNTLFLSLLFLFLNLGLKAQEDGYIRGKIFDASTGEPLPSVTIVVAGTTTGTITDLDGKFDIALKPGTYDLKISFISYETVNVNGVEVKTGNATILDDIGLKEATDQLKEVVVSAKQVNNTETALLTIKRKSTSLLDGISAGKLRAVGDADAAASMKRVTGVSVEGGKYVYVRGLGDRYTKTILNGVDIPGLDPDRNTLQMDIFPTNMVDNIIVYKTFSAELPADFTGGVIEINIKDFPEEKTGNVSLSTSYNPDYHFKSDYLTYKGGKTDFLGFDDGTRKIPATTNIPEFADAIGNAESAKRYKEILHNFNPTMGPERQTSFLDYGFGGSFGNQIKHKKVTIGYNFSASYKSSTEFYKNAEFGRYGISSSENVYEMDTREHRKGDFGVHSVFLNGLAGFAVKTLHSKYRINLLHLQNGESRSGIFDYEAYDKGSIFKAKQFNLDYSSRSLSDLLIDGKHSFKDSKWEIVWKLSPSYSKLNDPDVRFTRYQKKDDGSYSIGTEVGFPERIWRELNEVDLAGLTHITKEYQFMDRKANFKFGGAYTYRNRSYSIRKFLINVRGDVPLTGDPNELLKDENLWPYQGDISSGTTFDNDFYPTNANKFDANANYAAGYASTEVSFIENLKSTFGLRVENYVQHYTGQNQRGDKILDNDKVLDEINFFPTVNFIYALTEMQNLRFSYAKTIARPSIKELSYAEIHDPISDRTFIGGLFRDADDNAGIVYWDGNLVSTDIHNFDLRWEIFGRSGQTLSISAFYKKFINPIEMVQFFTQTGSFQPRNVGDGEVYGAETEFRVNLKFLGESFKRFILSSNVTVTKSRIKLSKTEYDSRVKVKREGQTIDQYRDMAGQAPYIINSGLSYEGGEKGFWKDFEAGLYYNVQGQTLEFVGISDKPDIYTIPFQSLNFNSSKKFGKDNRFQVGLKVSNLLNDKKEEVFKSYKASDQYFQSLTIGRAYSVSLGYNFF